MDSLALLDAEEGAELTALTALADALRAEAVGDEVTYVVTRNINFTNVCYTGCRFCAFAQRRTDADAYTLSLEQVASARRQAWQVGATEVCMQGGIHPDLPGTAYFDIAAEVKRGASGHARARVLADGGRQRGVAGRSVHSGVVDGAREAGLDSIPGTAAEILDDDVRWVLTKGKLPTAAWIEVVTTAHELGIPSTSTMMYGHVDTPAHWVAHLKLLRDLQSQHRWVHRVRAAAVRAHQLADLPGRPGSPGSHRAGEPGRARAARGCCCTVPSTTSRPAGSSWATRASGRCCAAASTTSAAR